MTQDKGASLRENWRNVPGFRGRYIVSDRGRIQNIDTGRFLTGERDKDGYRRVNLSLCGVVRKLRVNRVVCEAFHGPAPARADACHLDGNNHNDSASNLAWGSRSENMQQAIAHGTFVFRAAPRGAFHHASKFTDDQVAEMRQRRTEGWTERKIATAFGCSPGTAHKILAGQRYVA